MPVEWVRISHEEYMSGKYAYTSHQAGEDGGYFAKVFTDRDGNVEDSTYSSSYRKKNQVNKQKPKISNSKQKEGCLTRIIKAPLRFLWWAFKRILGILTLGLISSWLNSDE